MVNYLELFRNTINSRPTYNDRDDNVLIIDGLNSWIRIWQAIPVLSATGDHTGAVGGFLKSVGGNIRQFSPTRCIIIFDGAGGSQRRRKVFSGYKSNRTPNPNQFKKEFTSRDDEHRSMKQQIGRVLEYLELLPITVFSIDQIEADDAIAETVSLLKNKSKSITIVSSDRDFLQLVSENVSVWSPIKKILYTPEQIRTDYGVLHENFLLYRALTGDASDAIPGLPGLGIKTLIKEYPIHENKLDIESFIQLTEEKSSASSKKIFKNILENLEMLHLNYKLMQLHDVDISLFSKNKIRDYISAPIDKFNRHKILQMLIADNLSQNWNVDSWCSNTFEYLNLWTT